MNTLLGRLIVYVNTSLKKDVNYTIAQYIIENYVDCETITLKHLCEKCYVSRASIIRFCELFGYSSWTSFHQLLTRMKRVKENQMKERLSQLNLEDLYQQIQLLTNRTDDGFRESIKRDIQMVVKAIHDSKKIYMFGAIYPLSIATSFQTDMTAIGKVVYSDFQRDESQVCLMKEGDLAILLTVSGRYLTEGKKKFNSICHSPAKRMLISGSNQFSGLQSINYFIHLKVKKQSVLKVYDYVLMVYLDIVYVTYYQQYIGEIEYAYA